MKAMCFDLSSKCIGVTFAQTKKGRLTFLKTLAVVPEKPSAIDMGYTTKEPKQIAYMGNSFKGLLKSGEDAIPQKEAKKRVAAYKHFRHNRLLSDIGKQCGYFLDRVKPDIISIERNQSFNGILTTKLLAEIAGGLYFYAGAKGVPMYDYDVSVIRSKIRKDIPEFDRRKAGTEEMALDTKWEIYCRLRSYFEAHHPGLIDFDGMTLDESDSLAVFYYLYMTDMAVHN